LRGLEQRALSREFLFELMAFMPTALHVTNDQVLRINPGFRKSFKKIWIGFQLLNSSLDFLYSPLPCKTKKKAKNWNHEDSPEACLTLADNPDLSRGQRAPIPVTPTPQHEHIRQLTCPLGARLPQRTVQPSHFLIASRPERPPSPVIMRPEGSE
jgi:hypothetical protein